MKTANTNKVDQLKKEIGTIEKENILLKDILASSTEPILITTSNLKIIYVNPAWENLTGYSFSEVEGKHPSEINKSGKTPIEVYVDFKKILKTGGTHTTEEIINRKRDGKLYQVHCTFYVVKKDKAPIFYVQIMHDITKRKQIEELKDSILSETAHEIKTPITVLKLMVELHIKRRSKNKRDLISTSELKLFNRELDQIDRLVKDILESARTKSGKTYLNYSNFVINELITQTLKKVKIIAPSYKFEFMAKEDIAVTADKDRIEQVLTNLLVNSTKYSLPGTKINIQIEHDTKQVQISVQDKGSGIEKPKQAFVFDKFYKTDNKNRGFGLGLYIAREIIKMHKGKIWVKSEQRKGSTFYFTLPITKKD